MAKAYASIGCEVSSCRRVERFWLFVFGRRGGVDDGEIQCQWRLLYARPESGVVVCAPGMMLLSWNSVFLFVSGWEGFCLSQGPLAGALFCGCEGRVPGARLW